MNNVAVSVRTTEYWISYENARYLSETNPFTYYSNTYAHMPAFLFLLSVN